MNVVDGKRRRADDRVKWVECKRGGVIFCVSSRGRHTGWPGDWSSEVSASDVSADNRPRYISDSILL